MRKVVLGLLLASVCVSLTGCGGCGGGLSESQMRRRSRKRAPDEESPPAAVVAQPTTVLANQATTAASVPTASAAPSPKPAVAANPARAAIASNVSVATQPATPPPATVPLGPPGPIKVVIQNPKPAKPLTALEKRQLSVANLQKIGQALTAHAERTGSFPADSRDEQGLSLLSWRVTLLPDLGYGELYRQFRLGESWDSPHNTELLAQIPPEFQSPERFDRKTNYLGLAGSGQAFSSPRGTVPGAMEDGPESTIVLVEVDDERAAFWTTPTDFVPAADAPRGGLGGLRSDGIFALLGDGKVVRLGPELPDHQFLALLSPDGGESIAAIELLSEPTAEPAQVAAAAPATSSLLTVPIPVEGSTDPPSESPAIASGVAPRTITLPGDRPPPAVDSNQIEVPPEESLATARDLFRELFGKQYEEARTWQDKAKFADLLLKEAAKVEKNPAHYHELLRIARDVAVSGGDAASTLKAVDLLTQRFQFDSQAVRLKALDDLSKSPRKAESAETLRKEARELLLEAFDADRFDVALPAYERLVEFTRIKADRAELTRLAQRKQPLEAAKQAFGTACTAVETLKANPNDAAACETLGKYLCFVKNRWDAGLPYLVRAAEVKLRVVATIDLEAGRSPQDTLSLADHYWEMASDYKQPFTRGLHLRAALCYQKAQNVLPDGLEKLKAQKRIDEVDEIYSKEEVARALGPQSASTMD